MSYVERGSRTTFLLWLVLSVIVVIACASSPENDTANKPGRGLYVQRSWREARHSPGHRVHVVDEKIACSKCHDLSGDRIKSPSPGPCKTCHEAESHIDHAGAEASRRFGPRFAADCTACHGFSAEVGAAALLDAGVDESLAGVSLRPLRSDTEGAGGAGGAAGETEANGARDPAAWECLRCHTQAQGQIPAVVIHRGGECKSCHRPHQVPFATPADCSQCHQKVHTFHRPSNETTGQICSDCHKNLHALAKDATASCPTCHYQKKPLVPQTALFSDGHTSCLGCHRPHGEDGKVAVECRSCHEDLNVLGGTRVAAHQTCTSCHAPHDVRGTPAAACVHCHTQQRPDHPSVREGAPCTGCHNPHPATTNAPKARPCSSCHQQAPNDKAFHGGNACSNCHAPHHFNLSSAGSELCSRCHSGEVGAASHNRGHQQCSNCHAGLPHHPEALLAPCTSCHHDKAAIKKEHSDCLSCHEPHGGTQKKACGSCHVAEQHSAPTGHQACTNCHEPHRATLITGFACTNCHQDKAQALHHDVPGGCQNCHRPHGPAGIAAPPPCKTCHEQPKLPGLHAESGHARCQSCHAPHQKQRAPEAELCRSCHQNRKDHFPDSERCSSCHLFRSVKQ